jgi:hypothetical protein
MMHALFFAAAEVFDRQVKQATQTGRFDTRDALTAISISAAVGIMLFIWAYFRYRKKEGVKASRDEAKREREPVQTLSDGGEPERRRKRKRHRRREHRPRNPSLQQTGGLPPPRPEDQLPKH